MKKNIIDDGFNAELVKTAVFCGLLEIPLVRNPKEFFIPEQGKFIPLDQIQKSKDKSETIHCYIHDKKFKNLIVNITEKVNELRQFQGIVMPDCSLYYDMPLILQMANVYLAHQIGHYLQLQGVYVIPNVRWGDERTYTRIIPDEPPFAFLGYEKHGIYSIGTYGCCQTKEEKRHIKDGLRSMIKELEPKIVLVYGPMPSSIFNEFKESGVQFVHYENWTKLQHEEKNNG